MNAVEPRVVLQTLSEVWKLCPDMRLGQLMMTLELLAHDTTERSLWDLDDDQLLEAMQRFHGDLVKRCSP